LIFDRRSWLLVCSEDIAVRPAEQKGVGGIYNRANYEKEQRDALDKWADYVADLATTPTVRRLNDAQVVELKAALELKRAKEAKGLAVPLATPKLKGDQSRISTSSTASLLDALSTPLSRQKVAMREFEVKPVELPDREASASSG